MHKSRLAGFIIDGRTSDLQGAARVWSEALGMATEILPGQEVLELKYRVHVPPLFKRLIEKFNLEPRAISKYRMGMEALGLVGDSDQQKQIVANA